jgi:hypothetical protein
MSRLIEKLNGDEMVLLVALPEATVKYAQAAESAGADAVIISLDDSKDKSDLISLVGSVKIPVGLYLDQRVASTKAQMTAFKKLGFDFFSVAFGSIEKWMMELDMGKVAHLKPSYDLENLVRMSETPINAIEASVIPVEEATNELTVGDLQQYITISLTSTLPVIVPTQKRIRISEVPIIGDTGAKGLLLKDSLTCGNLASFSLVIKEFKSAIKQLKDQ